MPREFRDRIDGIASEFAAKLRVEEEAKRRQTEDEQAFLSKFRVANERHILPVLKELEGSLNNAVQFSAWGGGSSAQLQVSANHMHNQISFAGDYGREIVTVATNDSDESSVELSNLSREWVEREVEERIKKLLPS